MNTPAPDWRPQWHRIEPLHATFISSGTNVPGFLYPYPTGYLPPSLQKLPGLKEAFISGYTNWIVSPEDVIVQGEIVAARVDEREKIGKGYVYLFGASDSGVYFNGPYKPWDGHHFDPTGPVPVDKLFGKTPVPPKEPQPGL